MDYSGYNYQQQPQQHSYGYNPSQIQIHPYDQSYAYQQYYTYNPQYAYFPNAYQAQFQFQPESTLLHPLGVYLIAPESTLLHPPGVYPIAPEPTLLHPPGIYPVAPEPTLFHPHGVYPVAPEPASTGPSQYRGRGGRGGRPFRGAGRGRGHGRGHGMGGGRHIPSHSSGPAFSNVPARVQPPVPPRKVCCEICKVECNSPEILEQHKVGRKHQKNMRVHEESQRRNAINGQQSEKIPTSQLNLTDQPKEVQESEKNECPTENMGSGVIINSHKEEMQLQNNVGNISEVPAEVPEGKTEDNSAARGQGLKRKKKGGKGGKYMRTNDGSKPVEPAQTMSFRCELCDVKCESQVVYQSHVAGKKHLSKLRRASSGVGQHQQQALSGALLGLQAIYPPDINALSNAINVQVQQGDNDPQVLLAQLLMTVLSQAQVPATAPVTGGVVAQIPVPTSMAGPSYEPQLLQTNPSGETKTELPGSSVGTQIEGGGSETKQQARRNL
ncbi:hypothetical protein GmHk_03G006542 [Glycine max]|nr:hypothetical protein GmHk_03G006542 [Glycine max]